MHRVKGVGIYVGPQTDRPLTEGRNLMIPDNGALCKLFRRALLDNPGRFYVDLNILDHPPLHCHWTGCGQTAGVALWRHDKGIEAASAYFNGLMPQEEVEAVGQFLSSRPLPIPMYQWRRTLQIPRPVYVSFFFTPAMKQAHTLATAAPALAHSFFALMGTVEEDKA